ncbi:hypothetical protein ABEF95_003292 [Exophiala dermatitidis]
MHTVFTKNAAPPAGPYNQAFIAAGQIFCSGQLPMNPDGEMVFLSDMRYFQEFNSEYAKWFPQKPARSCIAVKTLPRNVDIEIEAVAIL